MQLCLHTKKGMGFSIVSVLVFSVSTILVGMDLDDMREVHHDYVQYCKERDQETSYGYGASGSSTSNESTTGGSKEGKTHAYWHKPDKNDIMQKPTFINTNSRVSYFKTMVVIFGIYCCVVGYLLYTQPKPIKENSIVKHVSNWFTFKKKAALCAQ